MYLFIHKYDHHLQQITKHVLSVQERIDKCEIFCCVYSNIIYIYIFLIIPSSLLESQLIYPKIYLYNKLKKKNEIIKMLIII
jgi:hypothetical protein